MKHLKKCDHCLGPLEYQPMGKLTEESSWLCGRCACIWNFTGGIFAYATGCLAERGVS